MGAAVIGIGAALAVLGLVFGLIGFGSAETTSGAGLMMVGSSVFVGGLLMVALGFILRILSDIADKLEGAVHFEPLEDEHPAGRVEVAAALAAEAVVPPAPAYEEAAPVRAPQELAPLDLADTREPPAWFGRKRAAAPPRAAEAAFEPAPVIAPEPAFAGDGEPDFEREAEPLPPFRSPLPGAARPEGRRLETARAEPPPAEAPRQEPPRHEAPRFDAPRVDTAHTEPRGEPVRPEPTRPEPPRAEPLRAEPPHAEPQRAEPEPAEPPRRELPGFLRGTGAAHPAERPAPAAAVEELPPALVREPYLARPEPEPESAPSGFLRDTDLLAEEPAPAEPSVTVLKSGTIGGMSYTLYSDGSIEADLPDGVLRFASLQALRDHVAGSVARD
ncbi:hypothetical protein [Ancylobacter sp. IITR112]|uniref:hypothetical protein n=1 Tax=Ancylobacter sp. IITR112 TaxID=3138073 RepID=UPI00352B3951